MAKMLPKINLFIGIIRLIVKKMIRGGQISIQIEKEDLTENIRFYQLSGDIRDRLELRSSIF